MFHLFLCSNLADVIAVENPTWRGLINWRSSRLQIIYFMSYRMLRVATLSYLIYRFVRHWSNISGQCFIPFEGGTGSPDELDILILGMGVSIAWDTFFIIAALVQINKAMNCRSQEDKDTVTKDQDTEAASTDNQKAQDMEAASADNQKMQDIEAASISTDNQKTQDMEAASADNPKSRDSTAFWTRRKKNSLIFLARFSLRAFFLTWDAYWTITFVLANRTHILGDEYIFSFGQVGALVTLAASFYKIWNSYLGKPCVSS
jgi:hypothetical protein